MTLESVMYPPDIPALRTVERACNIAAFPGWLDPPTVLNSPTLQMTKEDDNSSRSNTSVTKCSRWNRQAGYAADVVVESAQSKDAQKTECTPCGKTKRWRNKMQDASLSSELYSQPAGTEPHLAAPSPDSLLQSASSAVELQPGLVKP